MVTDAVIIINYGAYPWVNFSVPPCPTVWYKLSITAIVCVCQLYPIHEQYLHKGTPNSTYM